jgi:hypothetical protein
MSERNKTHNGRDVDGHFKVKQADVEDLETDPNGVDFIRDDVRLGGAVADTGAQAGQRAAQIHELVEENRENVDKLAGRDTSSDRKRRR